VKPKRSSSAKAIQPAQRSFEGLVCELKTFITESRRQIVRAVDFAQVQTCWGVGRYIVEYEQKGADRAKYGTKLVPKLSEKLTVDFGQGFDISNLHKMRLFYLTFPIVDALRPQLNWTHYRKLIRIEDPKAREWYIEEAITQNWSSRALERQINRLYYERLLSSRDKKAVRAEAEEKIAELPPSPKDFIRDPVLLEFLGLPETGRLLESNLEQRLIDHLQGFLLELGKGFAFIGRQVRVSTETKDFYIDLVFYNYLLKCFVIFDLKPRELRHEDIGQMDMYVRMYDDLHRGKGDNPTVGIILCAAKDASIAKYSILNGSEKLFATRYTLVLPSEEVLRLELIREQQLIEDRSPSHKRSTQRKR